MSKTASLNEKTSHLKTPNEGGESSGGALGGPSQDDNDSLGDQGAAPVSENSKSPFINAEQPAAVKGKQSDETIENLVALFREFLEAAPNPATSNSSHTQRNTAGRKRFFGLNKGLSPETGSNNRYDYEQKYPRDRPGEEAADNARVWLTYLDEAEVFDRERVDGWKETADVLLVFAGLFSGVITTFISQASQSLQQDNTQVSASLLFEITKLLRAQSSGTPLNNIPSSTLTPTSRFTPSTNAFLVNGLWFTSLAITLSTALFAVLAKQWLYYYILSIPGTANEKARARQLRFNGFELWKVGAIVDLLPILLHLAVGIFLTGIIILLFPLDIRIAWTIVIITGITYFLYFISVILPIRYPECPYTTSLTIYVGVLVFFLQTIISRISAGLRSCSRVAGRRMGFRALRYIRRLLQYTHSVFQHAFFSIFKLASVICHGFGMLWDTLFIGEFPKFTKWREEHIKKAVEDAAFLEFEALDWLYATSPNRSVHRIIARCVAVHPIIGQEFEEDILENLQQTLEISETNVVDLRYGLCLDLRLTDYVRPHWRHLLRSIPVEESQLEEAEYRSYSHITENVLVCYYTPILKDSIKDDLKLPLVMWCYFFQEVLDDATIAVHILNSGQHGLFTWKPDPTCKSIHNVGVVSFTSEELGWWKFECLYRHFLDNTEPDYSLDKAFETRYLLLITIYRNLTSDEPLIADKEQRQNSLVYLFLHFLNWVDSKHVSSEQSLAFFIDIFCVDAFWCESMTSDARLLVVSCLDQIWESMDTDVANRFLSTECHDLSPIYQWCSQDPDSFFSGCTTPITTLLFMPQNRTRLCTILLNDPNAVSHLSKCFRNSRGVWKFSDFVYLNLMDLLKSVNPKVPLFTILYDSSVLVQLWKFLVFHKLDPKKFLLFVKSKLDKEKLIELYAAMNNEQAQRRSDKRFNTNIHDVLAASAHEFGQVIGVSRSRLESATEQSAPECAADKDHDTEERAQVPGVNERKGFHSIANWTKGAFGSVWPKTSVE